MSAEAALLARLTSSVDVIHLLEQKPERLQRGWPADVLSKPAAAEFPRGAVTRVGGAVRRPGFEVVRVQLDWFVWPSGAAGGYERVDALDEAAKAVLDENHWVHGAIKVYALALPDNEIASGGPGKPIRRSRDYELHISPAAPE
ncbi:MAG: hypothetical protein ACYC28_12085 [Longimicrobiales bacterium]